MANNESLRKIELVKNMLKELHRGASLNELKDKYREELSRISPFEIVFIEQELIKEGIRVEDILQLCDLHVELFREFLVKRELRGLERGHPLELFIRENSWILKKSEALGLYAQTLLYTKSLDQATEVLKQIKLILTELKKIRLHYRKIQMLLFPYLERLGIETVPRVLWGREDSVIVKLRSLLADAQRLSSEGDLGKYHELAARVLHLAGEISELVFRENKILFPAVYALLPEGAWTSISEIASEIGYIVDVGKSDWKPSAKPIYPYDWEPFITPEQFNKLPEEFKRVIGQRLNVDTYKVKREGDIEFETGFLSPEEIDGILRSLPLELTYADVNDRVRFYSESEIASGFVRTKTILGRKIPYCHPPRLEKFVMLNVEAVKRGEFKYREFWTTQGDRIIRVIITAVRNREGKLLGVLEIVEDLTEIVKNPDEVKKKIMVL